MTLDPVAVALKFGFIAVLYLFLLWMARSALKDLRNTGGAGAAADGRGGGRPPTRTPPACTSPPPASAGTATRARRGCGWRPPRGCATASPTTSPTAPCSGRGDQSDIQLEDSFASTSHARLLPQGDVVVLEDLGSTNGTYLNGEPLRGPQPLHVGDRIRIGDSEFTFER